MYFLNTSLFTGHDIQGISRLLKYKTDGKITEITAVKVLDIPLTAQISLPVISIFLLLKKTSALLEVSQR